MEPISARLGILCSNAIPTGSVDFDKEHIANPPLWGTYHYPDTLHAHAAIGKPHDAARRPRWWFLVNT